MDSERWQTWNECFPRLSKRKEQKQIRREINRKKYQLQQEYLIAHSNRTHIQPNSEIKLSKDIRCNEFIL